MESSIIDEIKHCNRLIKVQMDKLLDFNISKRYNILNSIADCSTGDIGLVIASQKFYELANLIHSANFSVEQAKIEKRARLKSYFLRYAVLDYNSCYDYFEQIIYFAFDFFPDFTTREQYMKILKDKCRRKENVKMEQGYIEKDTEFQNDINELRKNDDAKRFFKEYDKRREFVSDKTFGIRQWANNIKHQGGFCFNEDVREQGIVNIINNESCIFSTENLLIYRITHEDAFKRLYKQNENIVNFAEWLFDYIFGDTTHIDFALKPKKFSANKNNFKSIKFDKIYGTEK